MAGGEEAMVVRILLSRLWTNSLLHLMDEVPGAQLP
jgi:hypothetical protein